MNEALPLSRASEETPRLLVAEMFGPTFQGEGQSAGQQAVFVQLSRCNLSCSWCDTPYTWDWSRFDPQAEAHRVPVEAIVAWVLASPIRLVVIKGGEPLLQQTGLVPLVEHLAAAGRAVEIETNGTIPPTTRLTEAVERFNVSPKLSAAGGSTAARICPTALRAFAGCGKAVFKFVIDDATEIEEIAELQCAYGLTPVWGCHRELPVTRCWRESD
ncbi:MAG: 7-carboxy-7-deazaguanine synthase QueE [Egibacteraceae bacterium]